MADLSLQDMLQIMDVAREMRADRELVSRELSREETVARLRERLLASTNVTGETLRPEEVDAAIELYLNNQHIYHDPPFGLSVLLAHLYIRRVLFTGVLVAICCLCFMIWMWLPSSRFPDTGPIATSLQQLQQTVTTDGERARITALKQQLDLAVTLQDKSQLEVVRTETNRLVNELTTEFDVRIVQEGRSAARRDFADENGVQAHRYYVIVQAIGPQGPIPQRIESAETGISQDVRQWGEEIPEAVYERLKADKQQDGILDERHFAVKPRGKLSWTMQLLDENGQPITRKGQILDW